LKGAGSEKQLPWIIRGRTITSVELEVVRDVLDTHRGSKRWRLAIALCERWQWRSKSGKLKVRSAHAVLVELERRGQVRLPLSQGGRIRSKIGSVGVVGEERGGLVNGPLSEYRPLRWQLVNGAAQRREWRELMNRHHYLGAPGLVGANLKYLVYGRAGQLLGAMGWQSAVKDLGCRDRAVDWDAEQRARWLDHVVNGVRFLVMPWVGVRHLASVMLSESLRLLQRDWPRHYGTAVWLVESFVDRARFNGASYRAANWICIGWTRGFAKRQGVFVHHGQPKEVYVYVMEPRLRRWVHEDVRQPLLTRSFLLAQRRDELPTLLARRTRMKQSLENWQAKLPPSWDLSPEDVQCVGQELSEFVGLFTKAFGRVEPRELLELYLQGLLSDTERKNVEAMALALRGPEAVRNLQRFVTDCQWDEKWMQRRHWEQCAQDLADPQGVWSIDASEFPKKGEESVGVAPQYCGALGKTANCQSGVFICYSSPKGHGLLDSRLYLPKCWFEPGYEERRKECRIPKDVTFATKPQLAQDLLAPLLESRLFPARWITCDCSFGNNETFLEELPAGFYYLAEIAATRKVWVKTAPGHRKLESEGCAVEELVTTQDLLQWETVRVSEGEKGPIVAAFARVRVYVSAERMPESERWLLLRNDPNQKIKFALSNAPQDIPMSELTRVSGARWPIERCFQEDKSELGLDHYEHRSWTAWHRHMRLAFLAQLFLLRLRLKYKKKPRP
jgi:SRSO17 transposase